MRWHFETLLDYLGHEILTDRTDPNDGIICSQQPSTDFCNKIGTFET
jgi:hypothetical protein